MTSEPTTPDGRATQLEVARKIALDLLAVRARSEHELRQAMARRNVPADIADELLSRFVEVGLIDDAAFAATLVRSRSEFSHRGRARIRQELREKGVDREVAEEVLAELDPADERAAALELAYRKVRSMASLEQQVAYRRLAGMLARRGYGPGTVSSVLAEVLGDPAVEFSTAGQ